MNRRNFLLGFATAAVAGAAFNHEAIKTVVVGHARDAYSRVTHVDEVLDGATDLTGSFNMNASGRDAAHWADGTVSVVNKDGKQFIQLGSDFNSGPLPDGWVTIHTSSDVQEESDTFTEELTHIAPLKAGKGAQFYEVPAGVTVKANTSVVIICRKFQQYIGSATVK